ncbi:hypothetical protein ACFQYP_07955 [Nonomuraea antimicrobica]
MRQLTALDAQFLNVETATTAAHVAGVALVDSADGSVNRDALAALLLDRLHLSPRSACGWRRCRSGSTTPTGSPIPTSTSTTTCSS